MNRWLIILSVWVIGITVSAETFAAAQDAGYAELKGNWQAVEMVDNGRVIPAEAISGWLPSGGRIEIVDNSIIFTSPKDGQRYARVFSVDATTYPRQLNIFDGGKMSGQGIYRIDNGKLVVCLSPPNGTSRPTDFSAREGSTRAMVVFTRTDPKLTYATATAQKVAATTVRNLPAPLVGSIPSPPVVGSLTDAEIGKLLPGSWKCNDAYGGFSYRWTKTAPSQRIASLSRKVYSKRSSLDCHYRMEPGN